MTNSILLLVIQIKGGPTQNNNNNNHDEVQGGVHLPICAKGESNEGTHVWGAQPVQ